MGNGGGRGWGRAKIDHLSIKPEPRPDRAFKINWPKRPFGPLKPWPGLLKLIGQNGPSGH
jgi:hypothetical protein